MTNPTESLVARLTDGGLRVAIENRELVIRIDAATLVVAVTHMPRGEIFDETTQEFYHPEVVDETAFLDEMRAALEDENEAGETLVHQMLDGAALHVMHVGGEGVISALDNEAGK